MSSRIGMPLTITGIRGSKVLLKLELNRSSEGRSHTIRVYPDYSFWKEKRKRTALGRARRRNFGTRTLVPLITFTLYSSNVFVGPAWRWGTTPDAVFTTGRPPHWFQGGNVSRRTSHLDIVTRFVPKLQWRDSPMRRISRIRASHLACKIFHSFWKKDKITAVNRRVVTMHPDYQNYNDNINDWGTLSK